MCWTVLRMLDVTEPVTITQEYPFLTVSVIEGDGLIDGQIISKGNHFILSNDYGTANFQGDMQLILSTAE